MRSSFEERLNKVIQVKSGKPISPLSMEYGFHSDKILEWVRKYDLYGEDGLRKHPNVNASGALKESLVREILEKGVPLRHVLVTSLVSRSALENWVCKVRRYRYSALYEEKQKGQPPQKSMARPKKKEPQTELEKLQAENLRLKAENALLKKAKALVEEKNALAHLNVQKP